jgi:hypothetical protein
MSTATGNGEPRDRSARPIIILLGTRASLGASSLDLPDLRWLALRTPSRDQGLTGRVIVYAMPTDDVARERIRADELRRRIARALLAIDPGDRLPTVRELAARHGASVGATQEALARFEVDGAITVDRQGRESTLVRRALGDLWSAAEGGPLIIALPLPSTQRIEGLATALKAQLADSGVESYLVFIRGSLQRMLALRQQRCHGVVMSALAAKELCSPDEAIVLELPVGSFVKEHRVYLAGGVAVTDRPLRVVMDRDSLDFQLLTDLEFRESGATFVAATYMQFPRLIAEHRADAVIWDVEEAATRMPPGVRDRKLSASVLDKIGDRNLRAAFVVRASDWSTRLVLSAALSPTTVMKVQGEVVRAQRLPEY